MYICINIGLTRVLSAVCVFVCCVCVDLRSSRPHHLHNGQEFAPSPLTPAVRPPETEPPFTPPPFTPSFTLPFILPASLTPKKSNAHGQRTRFRPLHDIVIRQTRATYGGLCGMPACGQAVGCGVCDTPELWHGTAGLCARGRACAGAAEFLHTFTHMVCGPSLHSQRRSHCHSDLQHLSNLRIKRT